jgi:hypothetical protein
MNINGIKLMKQEFLNINDFTLYNQDKLLYKIEYENTSNKSKICHYGINYDNTIDEKDKHKIEYLNYMNAMCHILQEDSYITYLKKNTNEYPKNVIMFDFIDFVNNSTHTTTLFKRDDDNLFFIDPSNCDFSNKFIERIKKICEENNDMSSCKLFNVKWKDKKLYCKDNNADCDNKILKSNYDSKFFSQKGCKEISIMISFNLHELQRCKYDIDKINDEIVKLSSNQRKVNTNLANKIDSTLLSDLYNFDYMRRIEVNKILCQSKSFIDSPNEKKKDEYDNI